VCVINMCHVSNISCFFLQDHSFMASGGKPGGNGSTKQSTSAAPSTAVGA